MAILDSGDILIEFHGGASMNSIDTALFKVTSAVRGRRLTSQGVLPIVVIGHVLRATGASGAGGVKCAQAVIDLGVQGISGLFDPAIRFQGIRSEQ
jgi:hypothetical protein